MGMQLFGKNYTGSNLKENLASLIKELSFIINYSASHNRNFTLGLIQHYFHDGLMSPRCGFITRNVAQKRRRAWKETRYKAMPRSFRS